MKQNTEPNKKLKDLRSYLKLSQQEFADKIGVSRTSLALMETGRNKVSVAVYERVLECFGVNLVFDSPEIFKENKNVSNKNKSDVPLDNLLVEKHNIRLINNDSEFLLKAARVLTSELTSLEIYTFILKKYTSYEFSKKEIEELNRIEEVIELVGMTIHEQRDLNNKEKAMIIRCMDMCDEFSYKYINEIEISLGRIKKFDDLLS